MINKTKLSSLLTKADKLLNNLPDYVKYETDEDDEIIDGVCLICGGDGYLEGCCELCYSLQIDHKKNCIGTYRHRLSWVIGKLKTRFEEPRPPLKPNPEIELMKRDYAYEVKALYDAVAITRYKIETGSFGVGVMLEEVSIEN